MNKLVSNPIVVMALGLLLGVGAGVGSFWKAAQPLVAKARESRVSHGHPEKPDAPWDFWTVEMENVASELKDTKAVLKKREEDLAAREARLVAERQELVKQRKEIENLRAEIGNRLVEVQTDEAKNIKSLAGLYSNMTPKATLTIFKEMDDVTLVKIFSMMKSDVVSTIFEEMGNQSASDPSLARRAAVLSEKLRLVKSTRTATSP